VKKPPHPYKPLADSLVALFAPLAEVVLHDVETDSIAYLAGAFSPREVGDASDLSELGPISRDGYLGPYDKTNWDGRRLRSISVLLPGPPATMLCVNLDVSKFEAARSILDTLLQPSSQAAGADASSLLRRDWHENLNRYIARWAHERNLDARNLGKSERHELIAAIFQHGGFEVGRSASYVANLLGVSRATIYNQLAALRKQGGVS
jgi:D-arginine utilization repressor